MNPSRDRIQCAIAFKQRLEKHRQWNQFFTSDLVLDEAAGGEDGRVRSYARYLDIAEPIYGIPLSPAEDALFRGAEAYREGAVHVRIDPPPLVELLNRQRAVLGDERKLHIKAIAEKLDDDQALDQFVEDLYRICDHVWDRLFDGRLSYAIWNVVLRRDGVGLKLPQAMAWHYDTHYPKRYFKFLIGLNASEEHGGGTELLSPEDSARFTDETGYVGYRPGNRISEERFDALATDRRIVFRPNVGDALMFWPARVLHRGLMPRNGNRLMLFVSACPISRSLISGRSTIARTAFASARRTTFGYDIPVWWGVPGQGSGSR